MLIPGLGEDFAGAERMLKEGVRIDATLSLDAFVTPLPVLVFPEPGLWEPSITW